jgi:hypothetical protein
VSIRRRTPKRLELIAAGNVHGEAEATIPTLKGSNTL